MSTNEIAVFGGGCFWCGEAVFQQLKGVERVTSGYMEGVEVIRVEYDPAVVSYEQLLSVYFSTHDPTTLNRQGNDVGEQYRSVIFYGTEDQKQQSEAFLNKLEQEEVYEQPIVTALEPADDFQESEDYHHNYYERNKDAPYCQLVINPKLEKLRKKYAHLLKTP
jgi:peptide-methionine (S)-S-oxide reductase